MTICHNIQSLHLLGSSHHVAGLDIREKISLAQEEVDDFFTKDFHLFPDLTNVFFLTLAIVPKSMVHQKMVFRLIFFKNI